MLSDVLTQTWLRSSRFAARFPLQGTPPCLLLTAA